MSVGKMDAMSAESEPQRIKSPFKSLKEWGEWVNANARPARDDDTPVLLGQAGPGPRRRATHDELIAFVAEQRARVGGRA